MPTSAAEFAQYDIEYPGAATLVQQGTIVYFAGAKIDESAAEPKLVAMQADADQTGGWVLLSNGNVEEMTAEQVAALPPGGRRA